MEANSADLPTLEPSRLEFARLLAQARDAAQRQAVHTAGKQESSQELKARHPNSSSHNPGRAALARPLSFCSSFSRRN